jgi:cell cycle checkpoint control protein RAD9A
MAVLNFTLSEEGVGAFRDALICLNKFSDDVSLEARKDSVSEIHLPILLSDESHSQQVSLS